MFDYTNVVNWVNVFFANCFTLNWLVWARINSHVYVGIVPITAARLCRWCKVERTRDGHLHLRLKGNNALQADWSNIMQYGDGTLLRDYDASEFFAELATYADDKADGGKNNGWRFERMMCATLLKCEWVRAQGRHFITDDFGGLELKSPNGEVMTQASCAEGRALIEHGLNKR